MGGGGEGANSESRYFALSGTDLVVALRLKFIAKIFAKTQRDYKSPLSQQCAFVNGI